MAGEEYRSGAGDERCTCNCGESSGWARFARGVSRSVACVVADGTAKNGERVSRICVGCVASTSSASEGVRGAPGGGDEDAIGSRRYIVLQSGTVYGCVLGR